MSNIGEYDLNIIVKYQSKDGALTQAEKDTFLHTLRNDTYYHTYLSGRFSETFQDMDGYTNGIFVWNDANGVDLHEAGYRVIELLATNHQTYTTQNETLPNGITGVVMLHESSPWVAKIQ